MRLFARVLVTHIDKTITQRTFMFDYDHQIEYDSDILKVQDGIKQSIDDAESVLLLDWKELKGSVRPSAKGEG